MGLVCLLLFTGCVTYGLLAVGGSKGSVLTGPGGQTLSGGVYASNLVCLSNLISILGAASHVAPCASGSGQSQADALFMAKVLFISNYLIFVGY